MKGILEEKKTKQYAIYGLGNTRLSIALANYYCSYLKKRVAIGEAGEGNLSDISRTEEDSKCKAFVKNGLVGFTKMKVDYYPSLNYEDVNKLSKENYEIIIWDVKILSHDYMNLFRLSDKGILLGNISPFNRRSFCQSRNLFEKDMVEVESYCYLLNKKDKMWHDRTYGKARFCNCVRDIPFIKNPDKLSREDITFLKTIGC